MLRSRSTIQIAKLAVTLCVLTLAAPGCSDSRTPYEAYLDCDKAIAEATSTRGVLACYTDYDLDVLRAEAKANDAWLAQFQKSRPVVKRLHEEQLQDVVDESILLIAGHTESGRPVAITVLMHRDGGRWKIAKEESLAKGTATDDARPLEVSLQPIDGPDWYPGELAGSVRQRPDGNCQLSIAHIFNYPAIRITTDCGYLATPGTYSLKELVPNGAQATSSIPVAFYDDNHTWFDRVESGQLTVSEASNGTISGVFTFDTANQSDRLAVAGSFTNLPFDPEG